MVKLTNKQIKNIQKKSVNLAKVFGTLKIDVPTQTILDKIREGVD